MTRLVPCLFLVGCRATLPLFAQTSDAPAHSDSEPQPLVEYILTPDGFTATKLPGDGSNTNSLRNFDVKSNQFGLDAGTMVLPSEN